MTQFAQVLVVCRRSVMADALARVARRGSRSHELDPAREQSLSSSQGGVLKGRWGKSRSGIGLVSAVFVGALLLAVHLLMMLHFGARIGATSGEASQLLDPKTLLSPTYPGFLDPGSPFFEPGQFVSTALYSLLDHDLASARILNSLLSMLAVGVCFAILLKQNAGVAVGVTALACAHLFTTAVGSVALLRFSIATALFWVSAGLGGWINPRPFHPGRARGLLVSFGLVCAFLAATVIFPFLALWAIAAAPVLVQVHRGRPLIPKDLVTSLGLAVFLPPLLFFGLNLDPAGLERILFGVSSGSMDPFLGLSRNAAVEWLTSAPGNLLEAVAFLTAVWGAPISFLAPLLGVETSWINPAGIAWGLFMLLHPPILVALRGLRAGPVALALGLVLALSFATAFPRSQALLGIGQVLFLPFALSGVLLLERAVLRVATTGVQTFGKLLPLRSFAALVAGIPLLFWLCLPAVVSAVDLGQGIAVLAARNRAMDLASQRSFIKALKQEALQPGCLTYQGEQTEGFLELLGFPPRTAVYLPPDVDLESPLLSDSPDDFLSFPLPVRDSHPSTWHGAGLLERKKQSSTFGGRGGLPQGVYTCFGLIMIREDRWSTEGWQIVRQPLPLLDEIHL